ncbi:MAG TPA: NAD(P)-dependent oxidoreductase, partial [Rubrobacter sp.]|nr:NAD(P)-dependent oxidoreductase [Rubrobacter sp.]
MQSVGFIGLGAMGAPMAQRIADSGFDLSVFDVRPENAEPLVDAGARRTNSPREAAEGVDALVLMVVNADQAEDALFGDEGAAETLSQGSAVVIMSTVGPEAVRGFEERLAESGVRLLDAPVSGGVARAERGDLLIMAGAPADLF